MQYDPCNKLQTKNHRNTDGEAKMLAFVANQVDSCQNSNTATQRRKKKEGAFGDSPEISFGFILVHNHKKKGNSID